ncbi:MAG: hypothetical protein IPG95_14765 [Saprospiraceae bacterium]|nr:hypothetical protein [Saprospiraceae bacterium]
MNGEELTLSWNKLPSINETLKYISELKEINLATMDNWELEKKVDSIFSFLPIIHDRITTNSIHFRARINNFNGNFKNVKELCLVPSYRIFKFERANMPLQRVMYLLNTLKLSCAEVLQTRDKKLEKHLVTVGVRETIKDLNLSILFIVA